MTVQCCVCAKVKEDNHWVHRHVERPKDVSHTYCPNCLEQSLNVMRKELAARRQHAAVAL
ncbi:MAG TPA: hypothetical protein PLI09_17315 [Candidatus Hydrogenedentes bacterium]|nr:hypothetical protein [Candidatus Hydrogenedentota bacterium]